MELEQSQLEVLKQFVALPTPTGSEQAGMLLLGRRLKETTGLQPTIDRHGNLHCVLDRGAKHTVMIEGHCDEIGFIVQYIDDDGLVYLSALGGVTVPLCASERIVIAGPKGPVNGVIGVRPPHLMSADERKHVAKEQLREMPCDIGAASRAEAEALVSVGNAGVVDAGWRPLAGSRVSCRGFDNRVGAFAMAEAFAKIANCACGTGCNQLGGLAAFLANYIYSAHSDCISSLICGGRLVMKDRKVCGDVRLGSGVAMGVGPTYHPALVEHFRATADTQKIPYQLRACARGTGTCAWAMRLERGGAAVAQLSIPLRYMHSPVEVIDLKDVAAVIDLVAKGVSALDDGFNLLPEQP